MTLPGVNHPEFTAFAQQDPDRVIVDLASAQVDASVGSVSVQDGLVNEIYAAPFTSGSGEPMARVEIHLGTPADYVVEPGVEGLEIRISGGATDAESNPVAYDPWGSSESSSDDAATVDDPWSSQAAADSTEDDAIVTPAVSAGPATQVSGVEVERAEDGTLVRILADGMVGNVVTFTLDDPARLVVDLPELTLDSDVASIDVGSPEVAKIRVGRHADKLRVVVDGGGSDAPFDGRRVVPASTGLLIALGRGREIDAALARATAVSVTPVEVAEIEEPSHTESFDAPETVDVVETTAVEIPEATPVAKPTEVVAIETEAVEEIVVVPTETPASLVTIYGVEFDSQDTRDRIVVLGDQAIEYDVFEPDPDTVIINLDGSQIDPEAAVRIAPSSPGPVSLVTAFGQPELETPQVRVVVQRAPNLVPEITRRGSLLVIDFPRTGEVAAAPPLMAAENEERLALAEASAEASTLVDDSLASTSGLGDVLDDSMDPDSLNQVPLSANELDPNYGTVLPAAQEPGAAIDVLQMGGLTDGKVYTGRRVSLDFKEVDITDVLRLIAEVSELNVIAGDEVSGQVTIRLVDVPWDQALDVVLLTKGLGFMRIGNVLRIAPSSTIAQEEEMRLQERRALEKLEDLVVKLQPVNYADVSQVSGMIGPLLSPRGSVIVDVRTSTLVLKDIASVIDEATALIKAIDTQTPQVLIEAKIVEASLDFSREFGAQWGFGAQPLVDAFDSSSAQRQDMGTDDFNFHNSANSNFFGNNAVFSNPITANPTGLFNMAAFLLDQKLNLELQLQAAEVNGDGKVISSPRVVTLDNSQASIEQGVSIPFQTFENGDAQLEFVDAVLKLNVTPHITADKSIIMKIAVNRNAPDTSVFTLTGSPAIAKNQVKTETLVKDGQTLVLGGIYVIDKSERESRVPYLHSIPIIGAAFRSHEVSELRKELLIFVTPRIIATPGSDI